MLIETLRLPQQLHEEVMRRRSLYWPILDDGAWVEMLPEEASVISPRCTIRPEPEGPLVACANRVPLVSNRFRYRMRLTHSRRLCVCLRSEVFAERRSRYSKTVAALPSIMTYSLNILKHKTSPAGGRGINPGLEYSDNIVDLPYFLHMSRRPSHGLTLGILRILPMNGRPLGPGGSGFPRDRTLHNNTERT